MNPTGQCYYNARWYDPNLGRFTTEDTIKAGLNWFIYANNNPLRFVDPTGLQSTAELDYRNYGIDDYSVSAPDSDIDIPDVEVDLPTFSEVAGENAASFMPEDFTGVAMIGVYGQGSAILSGAYEEGTGYLVEEGFVVGEFDYASLSFGFETNVGAEGGEIVTFLPEMGKDNALRESGNVGISVGYMVASVGANKEVVPTAEGDDWGHSFQYGAGYSMSPVVLSATWSKTWEKE